MKEKKIKENYLKPIKKGLILIVLIYFLNFLLVQRFEINLDLYADDKMTLVLQDANDYIFKTYGETDYYPESIMVNGTEYFPSEKIYDDYRVISYWNSDSLHKINLHSSDRVIAKKEDKKYKEGEIIYRYIGYDVNGKYIYNNYFPADKMNLNPHGDNLIKWEEMHNPLWLDILKNPSKKNVKIGLLNNFKKSLFERLDDEIERFTLYRKSYGTSSEYLKNWTNYFKDQLGRGFEDKISISMFPTKNSDGQAIIKRSTGYYISLPLIYQEKTDAILTIHHVVVDLKDGKYIVSKDFHPISEYNINKPLKDGERITVQPRKSDSYKFVGSQYFEDGKKYSKLPAGRDIGTTISPETLHIDYKYDFEKDRPVLVFYYIKNKNNNIPVKDGSIIISSEKFNVSNSIPSSENVKIDVNIKDINSVVLDWGKENRKVDVKVFLDTKDVQNQYKEIGGFGIDVEYYKLYSHAIYSLNSVWVQNKKLNPLTPIIFLIEKKNKSLVKIFSQNILKPSLKKSSLSIDGKNFVLSSEALSYSIINEDEKIKTTKGTQLAIIVRNSNSEQFDENEYLGERLENEIVSEIRKITGVSVRNDSVIIGEQIISSEKTYDNKAPKPEKYKAISLELTKSPHKIEDFIENGNSKTRGRLFYKHISGYKTDSSEFGISGNNVFIHTPTYNKTEISDESTFDQSFKREENIKVAPLDHVVKINISNLGQHKDSKGYGNKDYEFYTKAHVIKFPFDAYVSTDKNEIHGKIPNISNFVQKDTEIKFSERIKNVYFKPASWVREGTYKIKTYALAKNTREDFITENLANLNHRNYVASQEIDIKVTGRLFDFSIEKVYDPAYLSNDSNKYFTSGKLSKESLIRNRYTSLDESEINKYTLPVMIGKSAMKSPVFRQVKIGYPFLFSVKTMGSYFLKDDVIIAESKFYHLDDDGNIDQNIALYYMKDRDLIPISSEQVELNHMIVYKDLIGAGGALDIKKTENYLNGRFINYLSLFDNTKDDYIKEIQYSSLLKPQEYRNRIQSPVLAYGSNYWVLSYPFRTFIGPENKLPNTVDSSVAGMSIQKWIGMYSLPESTMAFKKDEFGNVDFDNPLRHGSIGVIFDIKLARENNQNGAELIYANENYNGWKVEGYNNNQNGYELLDGTVILYSLTQSVDDDLLLR